MVYDYNDIVHQFFEEFKPLFVNFLHKNYHIDYDEIMNIYIETWIDVRDNIMRGRVEKGTKWKSYIMQIGIRKAIRFKERKRDVDSMDDEKFNREQFEKEYTESSDGIVFLDAIRDTDIPTVLTLNRMRGLPDPDDSYLRWCYALYYRKDMKFPVIIPKEAKGMTNDTILSNGDIVLTKFPKNVRLTNDEPQVTLTQINGMDYVIQPFDDMFHLSPRIIDPGDRDQ